VGLIAPGGGGSKKEQHGGGCDNLFRILACSGVRIDEARHVLWSNVDFEKGLLHVRVTKNSKARWIPLNSSLRRLLEKMRAKPRLVVVQSASDRRGDCGQALSNTSPKGVQGASSETTKLA
jgi:integrase